MKMLAGSFKTKPCSVSSKNIIIDGVFSKEKIPLTDIATFDVESEESRTSGGFGTAAAGGLLFGGVGAVVGAVVGRSARTDTTANVSLLDGRRFMAKFTASEMDIIRAALFDVQDKSLDERLDDHAARQAKAKRNKERIGKFAVWVPLAAIVLVLVLSNT